MGRETNKHCMVPDAASVVCPFTSYPKSADGLISILLLLTCVLINLDCALIQNFALTWYLRCRVSKRFTELPWKQIPNSQYFKVKLLYEDSHFMKRLSIHSKTLLKTV